jgi:radical SAM protein with 4Fe4S-binding SPASM domain
MYEMAKKLKVKRLNIGRFSLESPNQAFLVPETEDIFISLAKLQEIYDGSIQLLIPCIKTPDFLKFPSGIKLMNKRLGNCNKNRTNFHCKSHHEQVTLFSNGNIALCYDCNINDLIIGNLRKQTFDEIWQNRFKNPIFKPRTIHNHLCKKCKYISLCLSGCPYRAYIKYGTTEAPGIECNYFKELEGEPV